MILLTNNDIKTILNNIGAQTFRKRMNGNISIIQKRKDIIFTRSFISFLVIPYKKMNARTFGY